ncbi:MAG: hypothetical protein ACTSW1_09855 [Candidatus Hodarchaeales archaeon]
MKISNFTAILFVCIFIMTFGTVLESLAIPTQTTISSTALQHEAEMNNPVKSINSKTISNKIDTVPKTTPLSHIREVHDTNAASQTLGSTRLFWVPNIETGEHYQINATLKSGGQYGLIYSNLTSYYDTYIPALNETFETLIYPTLTEFFGEPVDLDNNGKVIILLFDIIDGYSGGQYVAGFFYPLNQYLNSELYPSQRYSNEGEIIHIDQLGVVNNDYEVIAHEFQHLIHFGNDDDEDLWLDEGASMFSEYLIDRDPFTTTTSYKNYFQSNPDVSLTYWDYDNTQNLVMANYAAAYAFYRYIAEKYGGASTIQNIVKSTTNGVSSVEEGLNAIGYEVSFQEVFRNWTIANLLDDISIYNGTYGYQNVSLSMSIEHTYTTSPLPRTDNSVPYWGSDYLKFDYPIDLPFNFQFQSESSAKFLVTAIFENTTTAPLNTVVIPLNVSVDGFGNFSRYDYDISADEVTIVVSSYTENGVPDYSNEDPAPAQAYWYMVNPSGITILTGNLTLINGLLTIYNITVHDSNSVYWQEADGSTFDIISAETGLSTGITGNLTYNTELKYWEVLDIDVSSLSAGLYKIKYHFFNDTSSGITYSEIFTISENNNSSTTTTTTSSLDISFANVFVLIFSLVLTVRSIKKKK